MKYTIWTELKRSVRLFVAFCLTYFTVWQVVTERGSKQTAESFRKTLNEDKFPAIWHCGSLHFPFIHPKQTLNCEWQGGTDIWVLGVICYQCDCYTRFATTSNAIEGNCYERLRYWQGLLLADCYQLHCYTFLELHQECHYQTKLQFFKLFLKHH